MNHPNKIVTWNVNGIRANVRKGAFNWLLECGADVFCLQETKAYKEQLTSDIREPDGYVSYFDHSKLRKGYSGVATYSKIEPISVFDQLSLSLNTHDLEGRFMQIEFNKFVLINCYFPNGGGASDRLTYKLAFYDAVTKHLCMLIAQGKEVIICGDFNIVHKENDAARFLENKGNIGFLSEEQAKLDALITLGFVDVFRYFNPETKDKYTWWDMKTFARERNVGWRIDTFFATPLVLKKINKIYVHDDVLGSDHCPVSIEFY